MDKDKKKPKPDKDKKSVKSQAAAEPDHGGSTGGGIGGSDPKPRGNRR